MTQPRVTSSPAQVKLAFRPQNFGQKKGLKKFNLVIDIENNIIITYILIVELVNERPPILVFCSTLDNHKKKILIYFKGLALKEA